jgi:hypothetical protein
VSPGEPPHPLQYPDGGFTPYTPPQAEKEQKRRKEDGLLMDRKVLFASARQLVQENARIKKENRALARDNAGLEMALVTCQAQLQKALRLLYAQGQTEINEVNY